MFVGTVNEVRRHGNVTRPFRRFFAEQINKLFDIPFGNGQTGKKSIYFAVLLRGADGPFWGCDRAGARDYAAFLGFFSLEPS